MQPNTLFEDSAEEGKFRIPIHETVWYEEVEQAGKNEIKIVTKLWVHKFEKRTNALYIFSMGSCVFTLG